MEACFVFLKNKVYTRFFKKFRYNIAMSVFQSIKNEFRIPGAFENWSFYRKSLTEIVLCVEKNPEEGNQKGNDPDNKRSGSIAILGAGPCNDIDLGRISRSFKSIDLFDVDGDGLGIAVRRYGLERTSGVDLKAVSLTGITEEATESFFNRLYMYLVENGRTVTEEDFINRSISELRLLEQKLYKSVNDFSEILPKGKYDLIVAAGLHSQLWSILSYSWHVLAGNVSEQILGGRPIDPEPFHDHIKELDDAFVPVLNEAILESAKQRVVLASEYDPQNPVEGAWQCIKDVRERYTSESIELRETTLRWPFFPEQKKEYIMLVQDITKIIDRSAI